MLVIGTLGKKVEPRLLEAYSSLSKPAAEPATDHFLA